MDAITVINDSITGYREGIMGHLLARVSWEFAEVYDAE
jgi:hypothetical protein